MHSAVVISALIAFVAEGKCPSPASKNLVQNGGFERSTKSIAPWTDDNTDAGIGSPGFRSDQAYYLGPVNKYADSFANLFQKLNLCDNQFYLLDFFHKFIPGGDNANKRAEISATVGDLSLNAKPARAGWRRTRQYLKGTNILLSEKGISMEPIVSRHKKDRIAIDNVNISAYEFGFVTFPGRKYNVVENNKFKGGTIKPWVRDQQGSQGICKLSKPGADGGSDEAFVCKFGTRGNVTEIDPGATVSQTVKTRPHQTYILTFDMLFDKSADRDVCSYVLRINGQQAIVVADTQTPSMGKSYVTVQRPIFTGPGPTTDIGFDMSAFQLKKFCNLGVDNVIFKEVAIGI